MTLCLSIWCLLIFTQCWHRQSIAGKFKDARTALGRSWSSQLWTTGRFIPPTSPRFRGGVGGGMPDLAFGWDLNLLLPESPVCSNGGLRKRMAGLIMDGTILYIPASPCQPPYFPGWFPLLSTTGAFSLQTLKIYFHASQYKCII